MSNGNSSFKGVGIYMFTSNKIYTQRLSVTGNTNLTSVTVTDGVTITDGGLSVTGNVVSSGQVRSQTVTQIGFFSSAGATTIDVSLGQVFKMTVLSGYNISMFASNILPGSHVYLIITVLAGGGGGGGLMIFNSPIKAKTAFDTSTAGVYTIHFICDNTNLYELGRTDQIN